ncbi:Fic family protein [Actinosynnema sp. NPDC051121]
MKYLLDQLNKKYQQLQGCRPLPPELVRNLDEWFRVELTYTSNAIEGNTLTRQETALVVEKGITVDGKSLREHLEATNHAEALDFVHKLARKPRQALTEDDLLTVHRLILRHIDDANAGRYRSVPVRIAGTAVVLPNHRKVPELMAEFVTWLTTSTGHPVEVAAEAHYRLVTIHPFVDGNGRTARLLMNLLLLQAGYPPALIRTQDRRAYIGALEQAQTGGPSDDYYRLIYDAADRSLDLYLEAAAGKSPATAIPTAPVTPAQRLVRRGELAELTGVRPSTLMHYTEIGLLPYHQDEPGLARRYDVAAASERLALIRDLQRRGLSLDEVRTRLVERPDEGDARVA